MIGSIPCDLCEEVYGESRNWGGSHWHCVNCGYLSSSQGHYKKLPSGEFGFSCEAAD